MSNYQCPINVCLRRLFYKIIIPSLVIGNWTLIILSMPVLAQPKELVVNGENVVYDKANSLIEASGSVEVVYSDIKITGQSITYNTKLNRAWADRGFVLSYGDVTIEGETLDYDLKAKSGLATEVQMEYKGIDLSGRRVQLTDNEFNLHSSSFSTCDLTNKHYRVTANDIIFYPTYGWLVAYWGYFWLGSLPIVPMPTYIYDLTGKNRQNIVPFPDIGGNNEDGTYINERMAWYLNQQLSGSYSLTYATKKGLGGGGEANYSLNRDNEGNARLYYDGVEKFYGGMTHAWSMGEEVAKTLPGSFSFFKIPKQRQFELNTTLSYHERINYQRISYYPNLVFKGRSLQLPANTNLNLELATGLVAERYNTKLAEGSSKLNFSWELPEYSIGKVTPNLNFDDRFYSNGTQWDNETVGFNLVKKLPNRVNLGLGYSHYLLNNGVSPFNFEMYRFRAADRLSGELDFFIGPTGINVYSSYFLDTWKPDDIDYTVRVNVHCYNLEVKYRSMRGEFNFGFSLAETP